MKTAKLRRWSKGGGGKNLPFISSASGLYSYMQQSNVPQLEGNSICAAVRNAKYTRIYSNRTKIHTVSRNVPQRVREFIPFWKVLSLPIVYNVSRNLNKRTEYSIEENVKFPRRRTPISTSINQETIIPASTLM